MSRVVFHGERFALSPAGRHCFPMAGYAAPQFQHFLPIPTRWMDNDIYRHVNNVVYYCYFDTVVNGFLIERGMLDPDASEVIGLVVESGCQYLAPLAFPQTVVAGLRVAELGNRPRSRP